MYQCCLSIASVVIGIESPWSVRTEDRFQSFVIPWQEPDVLYRMLPEEEKELTLVYNEKGCEKYSDGKTLYQRVYSGVENAKVFMTARQTKNLYHIYYPPEAEVTKPDEISFSRMLYWEENFLDHNGFYLHSSCVDLNGKGVVFTAPSGTGKSTQASLWEKYLDAETINGDRTIVKREADGWKGYGSPYAGSSYIFKNKSTELQAIIILEQGNENIISKVSPREAFITLYRETVQNPWNRNYMEKMMDLLERAMQEIPIYKLTCRPDREAVELVYNTVFGEEKGRDICDRI